MMNDAKLAEAHKNLETADQLTTLTWTRWTADWLNATPMYEKAASTFRSAKKLELAKEAFEKAAVSQEKQSGVYQAAKHIETAGGLAVELQDWGEVARLFRRAAELFQESGSGRTQAAAEAYAKGARTLEDQLPDEAVQLYNEAFTLLEEEGREYNASDIYRAAAALFLKLHRYSDAAMVFLRMAAAAGKGGSSHSQSKAYLGAIIIYLSAGELSEARKCFNEGTQIDSFLNSPSCELAEDLLRACQAGDVQQLEGLVKSPEISHSETMVVRLARQLPKLVESGTIAVGAPNHGGSAQVPQDDEDLT